MRPELPNVSELFESTLKEEIVFSGRIITVHDDTVRVPGGASAKREVVRHHGGVCCAALNEKDELAFVSQYRYPYAQIVTELPAGKLEKGEQPLEAIRRELSEEVGAVGEQWRELGVLYPTPGYVDEVIHLFACRIAAMGETHPDEDENLAISFIPLQRAFEMVMRGELPDAKTQVLVLKLAAERGLTAEYGRTAHTSQEEEGRGERGSSGSRTKIKPKGIIM